jgi:transcriptional regulator with XRE-family HTH domain
VTGVGPAARLRALRIRAGLSRGDVARQLAINDAWYADLEAHDGELASTLSLFKVLELATLLRVPLHEVMGESPVAGKRFALPDLPQLVRAHARQQRISIEELQARVGPELRAVLDHPIQAASDLPLGFFQALAKELGINWLALAPQEEPE